MGSAGSCNQLAMDGCHTHARSRPACVGTMFGGGRGGGGFGGGGEGLGTTRGGGGLGGGSLDGGTGVITHTVPGSQRLHIWVPTVPQLGDMQRYWRPQLAASRYCGQSAGRGQGCVSRGNGRCTSTIVQLGTQLAVQATCCHGFPWPHRHANIEPICRRSASVLDDPLGSRGGGQVDQIARRRITRGRHSGCVAGAQGRAGGRAHDALHMCEQGSRAGRMEQSSRASGKLKGHAGTLCAPTPGCRATDHPAPPCTAQPCMPCGCPMAVCSTPGVPEC